MGKINNPNAYAGIRGIDNDTSGQEDEESGTLAIQGLTFGFGVGGLIELPTKHGNKVHFDTWSRTRRYDPVRQVWYLGEYEYRHAFAVEFCDSVEEYADDLDRWWNLHLPKGRSTAHYRQGQFREGAVKVCTYNLTGLRMTRYERYDTNRISMQIVADRCQVHNS